MIDNTIHKETKQRLLGAAIHILCKKRVLKHLLNMAVHRLVFCPGQDSQRQSGICNNRPARCVLCSIAFQSSLGSCACSVALLSCLRPHEAFRSCPCASAGLCQCLWEATVFCSIQCEIGVTQYLELLLRCEAFAWVK